ncbi:hypothetical protein VNO78_17820 [Psophocarpus tetragonolobus]|uniref:Uncharacterized protein n=1 Tax=Psophocarpus tetragonolobus TaxID=3891 RepID=A0AAN9SJG4_PSOTE
MFSNNTTCLFGNSIVSQIVFSFVHMLFSDCGCNVQIQYSLSCLELVVGHILESQNIGHPSIGSLLHQSVGVSDGVPNHQCEVRTLDRVTRDELNLDIRVVIDALPFALKHSSVIPNFCTS